MKKQAKQQAKQKGIAVISAMLLAALITIVVGRMIWQQQLLISELQNQQNSTQANLIADAAVQWTRALLVEDAKSSSIDYDKEVWATRLPNTPVEGGMITGHIVDAQQFFNLNNLVSETSASGENLAAFKRLLSMAGNNENMADALVDWIDADDITNGAEGAESIYYESLTTPYLAANQLLTEMGNLIRVKGFDKASINKIEPYTVVLPEHTELNVNTASAEVLSFMLPNATLQDAQAIVAVRNVAPFNDVADFNARLPNKNIDTSQLNLAVNSRYFLVTCTAQFEKTTIKVQALLQRKGGGWPTVLWKKIG